MRHPLLTLIAVLTAAYVLVKHPDLVIGVVIVVAVFVFIGHWFVRGSDSVRSSSGDAEMSADADRYQWTFDTVTGEPIGVLDTWYSPQGAQGVQVGSVAHQHSQVPAVYQAPQPMQVIQPAPQAFSPQVYHRRPVVRVGGHGGSKAVFYIAAGIFASGLYLGCLLFGGRQAPQPVVLMCTSPSSYPFMPTPGVAAPANCAPIQTGAAR
jgi:hypothetical protein